MNLIFEDTATDKLTLGVRPVSLLTVLIHHEESTVIPVPVFQFEVAGQNGVKVPDFVRPAHFHFERVFHVNSFTCEKISCSQLSYTKPEG